MLCLGNGILGPALGVTDLLVNMQSGDKLCHQPLVLSPRLSDDVRCRSARHLGPIVCLRLVLRFVLDKLVGRQRHAERAVAVRENFNRDL